MWDLKFRALAVRAHQRRHVPSPIGGTPLPHRDGVVAGQAFPWEATSPYNKPRPVVMQPRDSVDPWVADRVEFAEGWGPETDASVAPPLDWKERAD